jgi:DUF1680 family protein
VPSDLYHYVDATSTPAEIILNGAAQSFQIEQGYAQLERVWQAGDVVTLTLPMPIRRVVSHPQVGDTVGKVALERGPLVYCLEGVDNNHHVLGAVLYDDAELSAQFMPDLLHGVTVLHAQQSDTDLLFIPYYAWAHRGVGEMTVWLKRAM